MAQVSIRNLTKIWPDGTAALRDVSLDVQRGEFLVLLGPSGCGKSTLLRTIAGLEVPTSGSVHIDDRDVTRVPPKERNVAMVFQNYALYPHMTVRKNLEFPLKMARMERGKRDAKVEEVAGTMGLRPYLERKPAALSGGQMQRVALGRALVRNPAVFLFDEPLSNVDAKLRTEMRAELSSLHGRLGTTMIYVTHDQVEAMTMGQRVAVIHDGELRQVGPPLGVYRHPADTFVARFMGSPPMNLLRAGLKNVLLPGAPESIAMVGFRPEVAQLGSGINGKVVAVEALGANTVLHVESEGETAVLVVGGAQTPGVGEVVRFHVPESDLHRFDKGGDAMTVTG